MAYGTLYLIPTPLGDGPLEAALPAGVRALAARLDTFVVEHPKTARAFLKQIGTQTPLQQLTLLELSEHTPAAELDALLAPLLAGRDVGLISEAGCPAVADPGANLVRLAHRKHIRVVPLVGPSSIMLALMASGLNGQRFAFHGYLPVADEPRRKALLALERESAQRRQTQMFIETPYHNAALLHALAHGLRPDTRVSVACELTAPQGFVRTRSAAQWRAELHLLPARAPAMFSLLAARP